MRQFTSREWPSHSYIFLYVALGEKSLDTPAIHEPFDHVLRENLNILVDDWEKKEKKHPFTQLLY